ncbi:hypothetical protein [Ferrimicrobium sp.]|uniref:hypothetical protein n=1 Tax=Ferrimicrobium sp. TaxID=2926050 RepID=UPI0026237167|nr:hypothetical protein [Ferrimicrobium sp.]
MSEADTCRKDVVPRLVRSEWDDNPHSSTEQRIFTDGRIIPVSNDIKRGKRKHTDFVLSATLETFRSPQQAEEYGKTLSFQFALSTNSKEIVGFNFAIGMATELIEYPKPQELFDRYWVAQGL